MSAASPLLRGTGPRGGFRAGAYRVLAYALFIATSFTIAGSETGIILMMGVALSDPALWHWLRRGNPPAGLPYGGQSPPAWIPGALVALVALALVSAALNPGTLGTLDHMRFHYRVFLPLVLLLALPRVALPRLLGTFAGFVALWGLYGAVQYRFGVDWFRSEGHKLIRPFRPYGEDVGVFHAQGQFTHHITYGGVMLMATLLLLALATGRQGTRRGGAGAGAAGAKEGLGLRALWGLGAACGALGTVLSLARSAWFGMALGLLVLGLLRLPRRWALPLSALAILVVGGYAMLALQDGWLETHVLGADSPALLERLVHTSPRYDVDRVRMWQAGWLGVQDRPWFGAGMGNAGTVLEPYRSAIEQRYRYRYMLDAGAGVHNIYLQVAFDLGAFGLAAYLAVWAAIFVWSARSLRALRAGHPGAALPGADLYRAVIEGAVAGLAGSMAAGLFENNAYDKEVQQLILMLMGLALYAGLRIRAAAGPRGVRWGARLYPNYAGVLPGPPRT